MKNLKPEPLTYVLDAPAFKAARSPVTIANYAAALKRWAKVAGVVFPADLTTESARRFLDARVRTVAVQSAAAEYMAALAVADFLERRGQFSTDTLRALRRLAPPQPKRRQFTASFLTREQVDLILSTAPPHAAFLVRVAVWTGLRISELAGLRWEHINLGARSLRVMAGKTGPRRVALVPQAVDVLAPRAKPSGPVFVDVGRTGDQAVGARALSHWAREASKASGVKFTLMTCRHTRASWLVAAGCPPAKIAKQLGNSLETTCRSYAGLAEEGVDPDLERATG